MICNCIGYKFSTLNVFRDLMMVCDADCEHCGTWSDSDDSISNAERDISEVSLAKQTIIQSYPSIFSGECPSEVSSKIINDYCTRDLWETYGFRYPVTDANRDSGTSDGESEDSGEMSDYSEAN